MCAIVMIVIIGREFDWGGRRGETRPRLCEPGLCLQRRIMSSVLYERILCHYKVQEACSPV